VYVQSLAGGALTHAVVFFINSMIFWDILYRSQQGVSISVIEEIWTQNIVNLLVSPLKIWEWMTATFIYGMLKTTIITVILGVIAYFLYHFNLIAASGLYLVPLVANLLFFGWALGVFASALLIRWGHAAEALIWGIPFLIQPLSAIFYPLETLPVWLRPLSMALPSTYVFEGMREVLKTGRMPVAHLAAAVGLNAVFFALSAFFFDQMYKQARNSGRLGRLGTD
jgi:ABC-2 type transport system permease protein